VLALSGGVKVADTEQRLHELASHHFTCPYDPRSEELCSASRAIIAAHLANAEAQLKGSADGPDYALTLQALCASPDELDWVKQKLTECAKKLFSYRKLYDMQLWREDIVARAPWLAYLWLVALPPSLSFSMSLYKRLVKGFFEALYEEAMDIVPNSFLWAKLGLDANPISKRTVLTENELHQLLALEWLKEQGASGALFNNAFLEVFGDTTVGVSNQTLGKRLRRLDKRVRDLHVTLRGIRLPEDLEDRLKRALIKWRAFRAPPGSASQRT